MKKLYEIYENNINTYFLDSPIGATLSITSKCNLSCVHCYNNSGTKMIDLEEQQWLEILEQLLSIKTIKRICVSGGEPLIRFNLLNKIILEIDKKRSDITIEIATNGCLLNDDILKFILNIRNDIIFQFSLDGHNSNVNATTRVSKNAFDQTVNGIRLVNSYSKENIKVCVNHSINRYNVDYVNELVKLCIELDVNIVKLMPVTSIGRAAQTSNYLLTMEQRRKSFKNLIEIKNKYLGEICIIVGTPNEIFDFIAYISTPLDWILVEADGTLLGHTNFPYTYGTLIGQNILEKWKELGERYKSKEIIDDMIKRIKYKLEDEKHG